MRQVLDSDAGAVVGNPRLEHAGVADAQSRNASVSVDDSIHGRFTRCDDEVMGAFQRQFRRRRRIVDTVAQFPQALRFRQADRLAASSA